MTVLKIEKKLNTYSFWWGLLFNAEPIGLRDGTNSIFYIYMNIMRCSGGSAVQVPNMHPPIHKNALEAMEIWRCHSRSWNKCFYFSKTLIFWRFQQLLVFDGVRVREKPCEPIPGIMIPTEMVDVSLLLNEVFYQANMSVSILKNHNASCNDNKPLVWWKRSSVIIFQPTKWQEGFEFGKSYGCWCQKICSFLQVSCSSSILIWLSQPLFGWGWKDWFLLHLHCFFL